MFCLKVEGGKKTNNITVVVFVDVAVVAVLAAVFGPRFYKNYRRKIGTANSYQIENVATGKVIRPYNAQIEDDIEVIQYVPKNWECTTWQMIEIDKDTYLLKDLYTQKSFQPLENPRDGAKLFQKPIGGNNLQHWEFIKNKDNTYLIRLKGYDLYITSRSDQLNQPLILQKKNNLQNQNWKLTTQQPII